MPYLALIPISTEPPLGLTHRKCSQDEAVFKVWCKHHRLDVIGYENRHVGGVLTRFAAVAAYISPHRYEHPTIENYLINWFPSHTKPKEFRTAWERQTQTQSCTTHN